MVPGDQQLMMEEMPPRLERMDSRMGSLLMNLRRLRLMQSREIHSMSVTHGTQLLTAQVLRGVTPRLGRLGRGEIPGASKTGIKADGKVESGRRVNGEVQIGVGVNGGTPITQSLT